MSFLYCFDLLPLILFAIVREGRTADDVNVIKAVRVINLSGKIDLL